MSEKHVASQASGARLPRTLYPVLVLVAICLLSGALLGRAQEVTAPIAESNEQARAMQTYSELVPEASSFEPLDCDVEGCTAALEARDDSGALLAYVIVAQSKGYGGDVPIAVAFDPAGVVLSITAMPNSETPGLGTNIAKESYIGQYVGMTARQTSADEIDLISGATISSKAALAAFNCASDAFQEVSQ